MLHTLLYTYHCTEICPIFKNLPSYLNKALWSREILEKKIYVTQRFTGVSASHNPPCMAGCCTSLTACPTGFGEQPLTSVFLLRALNVVGGGKDKQVAIHGLLTCHKVYLQELSKTVTSHTQAQLNHHNFVYVSTLERATNRDRSYRHGPSSLCQISSRTARHSLLGANHDAGFSSRLAGSQSRRRILVPPCRQPITQRRVFGGLFGAPTIHIFWRAFSSPRTQTHYYSTLFITQYTFCNI